MLLRAFESDIKYWKLHRFVKSADDQKACIKVLRKHFENIKNIFIDLYFVYFEDFYFLTTASI